MTVFSTGSQYSSTCETVTFCLSHSGHKVSADGLKHTCSLKKSSKMKVKNDVPVISSKFSLQLILLKCRYNISSELCSGFGKKAFKTIENEVWKKLHYFQICDMLKFWQMFLRKRKKLFLSYKVGCPQ